MKAFSYFLTAGVQVKSYKITCFSTGFLKYSKKTINLEKKSANLKDKHVISLE